MTELKTANQARAIAMTAIAQRAELAISDISNTILKAASRGDLKVAQMVSKEVLELGIIKAHLSKMRGEGYTVTIAGSADPGRCYVVIEF